MCLEEPYYSQLNIFEILIQKLIEVWHRISGNQKKETATNEFSCDSKSFEKIKMTKFLNDRLNYKEYYEKGLINDRILSEIQFI